MLPLRPFHNGTFKELKAKYIDTGKVRFVLREFPLNPVDMAAYMLARCSDDKRDAVVSLLFSQQSAWANDKPLAASASCCARPACRRSVSRPASRTRRCTTSSEKPRSGRQGIRGQLTPTFFINGTRLVGNASLAEFEKLILPGLRT